MSKETTPPQAHHGKPHQDAVPSRAPCIPHDIIEQVEQAVKSIKYGVVQLIIQDGRVIQIDKTEKIRLV